MSVFKIAVPTIFAGLIAAGGPALAARTPANALQPIVRESSRDIAAFEHANVPLVHAIDRAEQRGGGQPVAVAFDADHGNPVYVARIYHDGVIWEGRLDATTNLLIGPATMHRVRTGGPNLQILTNPRMTMPQAVGRAEQLFHGKAIDARLIRVAGRPVYAIGIVKNGVIRPVVIRTMSPHANSSPVRSGIRLNQR
ncbi:MAG TPA: PepSY domain-containing protein [Stellaceae bacterium]|nr:PepSY domain-containing protein [Stellaceae bacterium]